MEATQVAAEMELENLTRENDSKLQQKDFELQVKEGELQRMEDQLKQKNSELQQKGLLLSDFQQKVAKLQVCSIEFIASLLSTCMYLSGADPEILHGGWLSGWLPVLYYTELWGVAGKQ